MESTSIDTTEHLGWVRAFTMKFLKQFGVNPEEFEELVGAASLGLVEAAERFDRKAGIEFRTFARMRVRGALLDGLTSLSGLSRQGYQKARALRALTYYDEADEIKRKEESSSGTKLAEVFEQAAAAAFVHRLSVVSDEGEELVASGGDSPEELVASKEERNHLYQKIKLLPEKERLILEQYYFHNKTFDEIGREHDMSKGWLSRVHKRAIVKLRTFVVAKEET